MLHNKIIIYFYNGQRYKIEIQFRTPRHEILAQLAHCMQIPPTLFKYCTVSSSVSPHHHNLLPFLKKGYETSCSGPYHFKILDLFLDHDLLLRQNPNVLNYVYFQYLSHIKSIFKSELHMEFLVIDMAVKLKSLNIGFNQNSCKTVIVMSGWSLVLNYNTVKDIFDKYKSFEANELKLAFINMYLGCNNLTDENRGYKFVCEVEKSKSVAIIRPHLGVYVLEKEKFIPFFQMQQTEISYKMFSVNIVWTENKQSTRFCFSSKPELENFLVLLDVGFKTELPSQQIINFLASSEYNPNSMVYHNSEYRNTSGVFNYSLVEESEMVLPCIDKKDAEKVLKFVHPQDKFLVTCNSSTNDEKFHKQYLLYFMIRNSLVRCRSIYGYGGIFKIDDQMNYSSLKDLFSHIELSDKREKQRSKNKEFLQYIKKDDIQNMRFSELVTMSKGEPTMSSVRVSCNPVPKCRNYFHQIYSGHYYDIDGKLNKCSVIKFYQDISQCGSYILNNVIEFVKRADVAKLDHVNVIKLLGVFSVNGVPCILQSPFHTRFLDYITALKSPLSTKEKFSYSLQIIAGIGYLHSLQIVHGHAVLHNIIIDSGNLKLSFIGILPQLIKRREVFNPLLSRDLIGEVPTFQHPARWLHRSMVTSVATWTIEVDRSVMSFVILVIPILYL